jgi:hypothetical protein
MKTYIQTVRVAGQDVGFLDREERPVDAQTEETTNITEVEVSVRTRSGGTVAAHAHRDGTVEISQDGHHVGTGRWQVPGSTIRDCAAQLGEEDGSETEALYAALDEAISDAIDDATVPAAPMRPEGFEAFAAEALADRGFRSE